MLSDEGGEILKRIGRRRHALTSSGINSEETEAFTATSTVKGMYQLFVGNIFYTLMMGIASVVVGRILGPSEYGLYSIALIFPPFLYLTVRLGLTAAVTKYPARFRSEGRHAEAVSFAYSTTLFEVATSAVSVLAFVALSNTISSTLLDRPALGRLILPVAILSVVGQATFMMTSSSLTALEKYSWAGISQAVQGLVKFVASVLLVVLGFGVLGAVVGYTLSFIVSGALGFVVLLRLNTRLAPQDLLADVTVALHYSFPVYLSLLVSGVVPPLIGITLAHTVSNALIGGYSAAYSFIALISIFTYPITTVLFPLFSKKVQDTKMLGTTYETATRFTALLVVPVATFFVAFAQPLITLFYGNAFSFGSVYLSMFAGISLLAGLGGLAWNSLLNGVGETRLGLGATLAGSVVSIFIAILLVQILGVEGVILGQILGQVASLAIATWMMRVKLGISLGLAGVWKVYAASAFAGLLCYPLGAAISNSIIAVGAGVLVFLVLIVPALALVRALSESDLDFLQRVLGFSAFVRVPLRLLIRYYRLFR